jgi:hypothetical protein
LADDKSQSWGNKKERQLERSAESGNVSSHAITTAGTICRRALPLPMPHTPNSVTPVM